MNNPSQCPHFAACSGCQLGENFLHPPIWQEACSFFKKYAIQPKFIADGFSQTRYKAKLAVRASSSKPEIGLFRKNTHEVISIPHCEVHHPAINRAVQVIREEMVRSQLPAYRESPSSGVLRYLQLFVDRATHLIQLVLIVNAKQATPDLERFCQSLLQFPLWHSIWLNFQPANTNQILGPSWQLMSGEPFLWQTLYHTQIAFHPGAFSQAHLPLFDRILEKMESWVERDEKILELYAGAGAISLSLHQKSGPFHLIENNPFAHFSFQESLQKLTPEKQARFSYTCSDAKIGDLAGSDLIIVDPPRKGLDRDILAQLSALKEGRLIYLSCGFESFKRDSEELLVSGWTFKEANGYLLFPGTNHVEILALLEKS